MRHDFCYSPYFLRARRKHTYSERGLEYSSGATSATYLPHAEMIESPPDRISSMMRQIDRHLATAC